MRRWWAKPVFPSRRGHAEDEPSSFPT